MKHLLTFCLIFLYSCASKQPAQIESLTSLLNQEEKEIYSCLQKSDDIHQCLAGSIYQKEIHRTPSAAKASFIEQNAWLFSSEKNKFEFYKVFQKFLKMKAEMNKFSQNLVEDRGVGVYGEAFFGFGFKWVAEMVVNNQKIGLFCAPGEVFQTDAGLVVGAQGLVTLSCPDNQAYQGGFLSFNAGVSGEAIGLPFGVGMGYSLGVNGEHFMNTFKKDIKDKKLDTSKLSQELIQLSSISANKFLMDYSKNNPALNVAFFNFGLKMLQRLMYDVDSKISYKFKTSEVQKALEDSIFRKQSLGKILKDSNSTQILIQFLKRNQFPELGKFYKILASSLTGCDSLGGAASISLTVSPISVGLSYTKYSLLAELPVGLIDSLAIVSPLHLLEPRLMSYEDLKGLVKAARELLYLPQNVRNNCGSQSFLKF